MKIAKCHLYTFLAAGVFLLLQADTTEATLEAQKLFKETYSGKAATYYTCAICHSGKIGKKDDLNPYGESLGLVLPAKLTVENLKATEPLDSDGDGVSNLDEINAGTSPGDPISVPEKGGNKSSYKEEEESKTSHTEGPSHSEPKSVKAEYLGLETCTMCHAKEAKEFEHSTHARISIPGELGAEGCEMCHGPGSLHVEAGGGRGVGGMINPRKDPEACFQCHLDKKAEFHMPYHHPLMEGKMSCSDCHEAHGAEVRPWSTTSMKDINEACFRCHKEQRGPFVWEHEAVREGCTSCHKVHGSIHQKMLLVRDNNLCFRCHTQTNFPTFGKRSHATYIVRGRACWSGGCHTAPHGSNFDDHLRY